MLRIAMVWLVSGFLFLVGLILSFTGCSTDSIVKPEEADKPMYTFKIPPIDEATPAIIETATFALG